MARRPRPWSRIQAAAVANEFIEAFNEADWERFTATCSPRWERCRDSPTGRPAETGRAYGRLRGPAALLVIVMAVGCGGDDASSGQPEVPGRPQPVATFVGDGLLPGDQRAADRAAVTTKAPRLPIGRPLHPLPANRTPVTRPQSQSTEVITTSSTSP
jgi:hypothetical protein